MELKTIEDYVLKALEENKRTRENDFILYGSVLKRMGIDLKAISLYEFLATAKDKKVPTFESVSRARRHIQELVPKLKDGVTAIYREEKIEEYKNYNIPGIGD